MRQLYRQIARGEVDNCSLESFQEQTGLSLLDGDGSLRREPPPMSKFLNRVLALTIARQNSLFAAFETVLEQMLEGMRAVAGWMSASRPASAQLHRGGCARRVHPWPHRAKTSSLKIIRKDKLTVSFRDVLARRSDDAAFLVNARSGRRRCGCRR